MSKSTGKYKNLEESIDKSILIAAFLGERKAVEAVVQHYEPYMKTLCTYEVNDYNGEKICKFVDEDLQQIMRIKIQKALLCFPFS